MIHHKINNIKLIQNKFYEFNSVVNCIQLYIDTYYFIHQLNSTSFQESPFVPTSKHSWHACLAGNGNKQGKAIQQGNTITCVNCFGEQKKPPIFLLSQYFT